MTHRIIFALQKGGVGKSSSTVAVSEILAETGYKVLVVDFDPQGKHNEKPFAVLKRLLAPIENRYDFVFVDIGPSLGDTVVNAIVYADHIIVPVDMGDLAMEGMIRFIEFVEATAEEGHTKAEITGILLTMRDGRVKNEREISDGIRAIYNDLVFDTEIHRRARIKEIASKGVDLNNAAMGDYIAFTDELLKRIERKETQ